MQKWVNNLVLWEQENSRVDVYYNDIKHRMQTMLKRNLKKSGKQRELHRQSRKENWI